MNDILYVITTGCTWEDVPHHYSSKSTVHRLHLYSCEHSIYQKILNELLNKVYGLNKIDLSHAFTDTKDVPAKKGETSVEQLKVRNEVIRISSMFFASGATIAF